MSNFTHVWRVPTYRGAAVFLGLAADIPASRLLVLDTTNSPIGALPAVALPATASTPKTFAGISPQSLIRGRKGDVAIDDGDVVVCLADGPVAVGDRLTISTALGKEGFAKTDLSSDALKVGYAMEAAADGAAFNAILMPKLAEV